MDISQAGYDEAFQVPGEDESIESIAQARMVSIGILKKRRHGVDLSECEEELSRAETCLAVLEFCSQGDIVARGYADMLTFYFNALKPSHSSRYQPPDQSISNAYNDRQTSLKNVIDGVSNVLRKPFDSRQDHGWQMEQNNDNPGRTSHELLQEAVQNVPEVEMDGFEQDGFKDGIEDGVEYGTNSIVPESEGRNGTLNDGVGIPHVCRSSIVTGSPFQWSVDDQY
ncbi:MAG: hypothetical protein Q9227_000574 [Pyrenula ochraceoflavens]